MTSIITELIFVKSSRPVERRLQVRDFLAIVKTNCWPYAVFSSLVGLRSHWHIPDFNTQCDCTWFDCAYHMRVNNCAYHMRVNNCAYHMRVNNCAYHIEGKQLCKWEGYIIQGLYILLIKHSRWPVPKPWALHNIRSYLDNMFTLVVWDVI